ncbi:hypothetical protein F2Q70_00036225 [Brassica cretica]|uniref:TIR domain-containing protein n=1 Tax=Brassica cretica TaxID=69181 RepID=A0A8S9JSL0_BRACR|nr:hypothetical protein F2Q70_00036225 [Brassica cretica]
MTISSPSNFGSVFLNYRGDQLRYGFVSHLIDAFERYGIMFFIDKDEQRGKDLTNLFVRMKESKIALVIFSSSISRSPSFGSIGRSFFEEEGSLAETGLSFSRDRLTVDRSVLSPPRAPLIAPKQMDPAIRVNRDDTAARSVDSGTCIEGTLGRSEGRRHPVVDHEHSGASDDDGGVGRFVCDSRPAKVGHVGQRSSNSEAAGKSSRRSIPATERLTPFRFLCDGTIEELPDLAPSFDRSCGADGQDWGDVAPTRSTLEGVSLLMEASRASGVTFMIPRSDQRPWNPPVGYCCVYESFFGEDSRLWFPIPRLITSYCFRRGIAISQLMNGAVRIAVALMVMAAEIDVSLTIRIFEELTQVQPKPNGLYSVQMRSGLNVFTSPLIKTKRWQRSYFYVKADEAGFVDPLEVDRRVLWNSCIVGHPNTFGPWDAFRRDLPKIVTLRPQEWKDFGRKRIRRQRRRVANVDWGENVPCEEPKGKKRLKFPIMGTPSKVYPDYSEILAAQLRDANFGPSVNTDGTGSAAADSSIDRAPAPVSITVDSGVEGPVDVRPPKKKRKRTKYAESSWCMDELVNIKKRAEKGKLEVIPIFYKVRAKDVRAQTGKFGDKFWALEKVSSGDQIKKWKDALECISNKMGLSLRDKSSEADFIKGIVKEVERVRTATVRGGAQSHHCIKFIPNKRIKICKKFPEDEAKSVEIAHMNFSNARGEEEQIKKFCWRPPWSRQSSVSKDHGSLRLAVPIAPRQVFSSFSSLSSSSSSLEVHQIQPPYEPRSKQTNWEQTSSSYYCKSPTVQQSLDRETHAQGLPSRIRY